MAEPAGSFDRRIDIQIRTDTPDAANDAVPAWSNDFRRWASKEDMSPSQSADSSTSQTLRENDCIWVLRMDTESKEIAPETHRIVHQGRVYQIVGMVEGRDARGDVLRFTTACRPDQRGSSAPIG